MKELTVKIVRIDCKLKKLAIADPDYELFREFIAKASRSVSVTLHNKHSMTKMAVSFSSFLCTYFSDLPNYYPQIKEDLSILEKQLSILQFLNKDTGSTMDFMSIAQDEEKSFRKKSSSCKISKKMKLSFCLMLILLIVAGLLTFWLHYRNKGLAAYNSHDYKTAISYLEYTPFAKDQYYDACMQLGNQCMKQQDYEGAITYFKKVSPKQAAEALTTIVQTYLKDEDYEKAYTFFKKIGKLQQSDSAHTIALTLMKQGNFTEACRYFKHVTNPPVNEFSYCQAMSSFHSLSANSDHLFDIRTKLEQCGDYLYSKKYINILTLLIDGNYSDAISAVKQLPQNSTNGITHKQWEEFIRGYLDNVPFTSLEEGLQLLHARSMLTGAPSYTSQEFAELVDTYDSAIGTLPENNTHEFSVPSLERLFDSYGSNSKGKVVILKSFRAYDTSSRTYAISLELMQYLPEKYVPKSIDEVEYIIILEYDYRKDPNGFYFGTAALQETAEIQIYSLSLNDYVYVSPLIEGPNAPSSFFYSSVEPPKFKSGGRPKVARAFCTAMSMIDLY